MIRYLYQNERDFCVLYTVIATSLLAAAFTVRAFPVVLLAGVLILAYLRRADLIRALKSHFFSLCVGGAVIAMGALSALWSIMPDETLSRTGKLVPVLAGGILFLAVFTSIRDTSTAVTRRTGRERAFLSLLSMTYCIGCLLMISEVYFDFPFYRFFNRIPDGEILSRNLLNKELAVYVFAFFPIAVMTLRVLQLQWVVIFMAFLLFTLLATMTNQSLQVAILVMGVVFFIMTLLRSTLYPQLFTRIVALVLVSGFLAAPFIAVILFESFRDVGTVSDWVRDASLMMRLEIWDFIAREIINRPFFGHGMEATRFMTFETDMLFYPQNTVHHPHNAPLQIWLEFGAAGIALAIGTIPSLMRRAGSDPLSMTVVCGLVMVSLFGWGLWQGWWLTLVFFSIVLARLASHLQETVQSNNSG